MNIRGNQFQQSLIVTFAKSESSVTTTLMMCWRGAAIANHKPAQLSRQSARILTLWSWVRAPLWVIALFAPANYNFLTESCLRTCRAGAPYKHIMFVMRIRFPSKHTLW